MATSIPEVLVGTLTATSTNVPITTTLVPSDLVVLFSSYPANNGGRVTPTGLGTWSGDLNGRVNGTNDYGFLLHTLTGVTGAGNVTLTMPTATYSPQYVMVVIRGLAVPSLSTYSGTFTNNGPGTLNALARDGAVAFSIYHAGSGTPTNPSAASPASGWVLDRNTSGQGGISVAHNTISGTQTVSATVTGTPYALASQQGLYIFGTDLEPQVHNEYVETLYNGAGLSPDATIRGEHVSVLRNDAVVPRAVRGVTADVLRTDAAASPRKISGETLDVIQQVSPADVSATRIAGESVNVLSQALPGVALRNESVNVISSVIPPAASATVYGDRIDALVAARRIEIQGTTVEVLRKYVNPNTSTFMGWGIPFTG